MPAKSKKDDPKFIQAVRDVIAEHPEYSIEKIAIEIGIGQTTVHSIVKSNDVGYQKKIAKKTVKVR